MNLHEIGLKHKTDKATYHSFTKVYDPVLEKYIGKNINEIESVEIFEVGPDSITSVIKKK